MGVPGRGLGCTVGTAFGIGTTVVGAVVDVVVGATDILGGATAVGDTVGVADGGWGSCGGAGPVERAFSCPVVVVYPLVTARSHAWRDVGRHIYVYIFRIGWISVSMWLYA